MADDERVTLRLPKEDLQLLDSLVNAHVFGSRSEVIRQAIGEFFHQKGPEIQAKLAARHALLEVSPKTQSFRTQLELNREAEAAHRETESLRKVGKQ
ncbi:MAG: ribbon-helix-helix domain-containing protein [Thermoplasmatota archaeon]